MSNPAFEPIERDMAKRIGAVLEKVTRDREDMASKSQGGNTEGVQQGLEKMREVLVALGALNQALDK